jgi:hypothetical protein
MVCGAQAFDGAIFQRRLGRSPDHIANFVRKVSAMRLLKFSAPLLCCAGKRTAFTSSLFTSVSAERTVHGHEWFPNAVIAREFPRQQSASSAFAQNQHC